MLNVPSFSEDMLPRHFPKTKGQLEQNAVVPIPSLPGLSLLLDDDNNATRPEAAQKSEPKKSFEQWKQQHKAMFIDNSTPSQRKSEKKQVRFETDNQRHCILSDKPSIQRIPQPVSPNLELSYYEGSNGERNVFPDQLRKEHPQQNFQSKAHCQGNDKNNLLSRCNYELPISSRFSHDKAYNGTSQSTAGSPHGFHQFNELVRSEAMKENYFSAKNATVQTEQRQCHGSCCKQTCLTNKKKLELLDRTPCNHGMQFNECIRERRVRQSHQQGVEQQEMSPLRRSVKENFNEQLTDDTLLSIVEEQQEHILLQQSQILMQQKQNTMQQNQIFMLQHQVQQLLLRNGKSPNESPIQPRQTFICEKVPTPSAPSNGLQNTTKSRSGSADAVCSGGATRSSIGVMTSFVNDCMPNGMHQFNERFTTKLTNQKFIENIGGFSPHEYAYKDSMLDKINDAIQNSSAMIDYRSNGTADGFSNGQSDINVAAQALYYETSSTNNGCISDQKTTDRSFALYMLGMKYDCTQDDGSKKSEKRELRPMETNGKNNVSVNISPEIYDYLKRHGLLKEE